MPAFWQFARQMLHYKRLLLWALVGALFDALCAFAGMGTFMAIIKQFFGESQSLRSMAREALQQPIVFDLIGDRSHWADALPTDPFAGFALTVGVILVLAVLGSCGRFMHQYFAITVSLRTVMRIRKQVFQRVVHMPLALVDSEGVSDMVSRAVVDCNYLSRGFSALTSRAVRDLLLGTAFLAWAVIVDWRLSLLFLIGLPAIIVLVRKFGKHIRRAVKRALGEYGVMIQSLNEATQSLRVVKVHEAEGYERRRFGMINKRLLAQELRARLARALSSPVLDTIGIAGLMTVSMIAAWLIFRRGLDEGQVIQVLVALGAAGMQYKTLGRLSNDLHESDAAAGRIRTLLQTAVEASAREQIDGARRLPRHRATVAFENISFTYPEASQSALDGINLSVNQGTVCAIVGGNGSGKSTLIGLVPRLYEPTEGRVTIDGHDLGECTLRSVRRQIAMVTQRTVLFDGTIADNISYGSRHVSREQLIDASKLAHAHEFIDALPEGYDTDIGEWGGRLSGGQRQRIAIARAILRDPAILLLDEATSQIDSESESHINAALAQFTADRTTFVVAHRLGTVIGADMIVVLDAGRICATGRHDELLAHSDVYQLICRTQLHGAGANATPADG